jgi:probable HAF family extracellular repeat protein
VGLLGAYARSELIVSACLIVAVPLGLAAQPLPHAVERPQGAGTKSPSVSPPYVLEDANPFGANHSQGWGISDAGNICGISFQSSRPDDPDDERISQGRPFLLSHGTLVNLALPEGQKLAWPPRMGSFGVIFGISSGNNAENQLFVYFDGVMRSVPIGLTDMPSCAGSDGRIGGSADLGRRRYLCIWQPGRPRKLLAAASDLSRIINFTPGGVTQAALANGITSEQIVSVSSRGLRPIGPRIGGVFTAASPDGSIFAGWLWFHQSLQHAFIRSYGKLCLIGTLGGNNTVPAAVNNSGTVVGYSAIDQMGILHGFVWQAGRLRDLNTLIPANSGWTLEKATGINARGDIVGTGLFHHREHAFVLRHD